MNAELIIIIAYSVLTPIISIYAFTIGYNLNANRKFFTRKSKNSELTEDEKMLERIDSAKVYDEVI